MTTDVPAGGLSTVRNAARLLKVFRSREADLGVSELALRLGLRKSTVHRMLTTLVAEALIQQNPLTLLYPLLILIFYLLYSFLLHLHLHSSSPPFLIYLLSHTSYSSHFPFLHSHYFFYLYPLYIPHSLLLFTYTSPLFPFHFTISLYLFSLSPPPTLSALAAEARPDPDAVRRELLAAVGGRTQWQPPEEPSPSAQPTRPAPSAQPTRPAP